MTEDAFHIDDQDRYGRLRLIPWWDQQRLHSAKVLVVGAGALGNEVLKNLVLVGIGQILIVDFDTVEDANLTRSVLFRASDRGRSKAVVATEALRHLNPDCDVRPLSANVITDVGLGIFEDADVVIGCLDNREARLWVNRCCWKVGTPWVDGGIQEVNGVVKVFVPPQGACYECAMTEMDYRLLNLRYSCPLLRHEDMVAGKVPTAPTISSIVGGWQAQEALKLLHGLPTAEGQALVFNGMANQFYTTRFQRKEECLSHETYEPPLGLDFSVEQTAAALFAAVDEQRGDTEARCLVLDRDLVKQLVCEPCRLERDVFRVRAQVTMEEAVCEGCGQPMRPEVTHHVDRDDPLAGHTLRQLGVPAYDIVKVAHGDQLLYCRLEADRDDAWRGDVANDVLNQT